MNKKRIWLWFFTFSCLVFVLLTFNQFRISQSNKTNPAKVQIANPIMKVESLDEMEDLLDFTIPVLDKPIESYTIIVMDQYPSVGRIYYEDGSIFSMQYGTGDISGIYGGKVEKKSSIQNISISFCTYEDIQYALWESDGFTYSLTSLDSLEEEVASLISQ